MSIVFEEREERPALVRFEKRAIHDKAASLQIGKAVYRDIDYALVTAPYTSDVFIQEADSWFDRVRDKVRNGRVPQKHLDYWEEVYSRWLKGQDAPVNGTDIRNWSAITPAEVKMLQAQNILSIEDLANAPDEILPAVGGINIRNKARAYVKASTDTGPVVLENAELKIQLDIANGSISSLEEQVRHLKAQLSAYQSQGQQQYFETPASQTPQIAASDLLDEVPPNEPQNAYQEVPRGTIEAIAPVESQAERAILANQYKEKFGRLPHPHMHLDKLKAKLAEE